jgi:hypothetical protein
VRLAAAPAVLLPEVAGSLPVETENSAAEAACHSRQVGEMSCRLGEEGKSSRLVRSPEVGKGGRWEVWAFEGRSRDGQRLGL